MATSRTRTCDSVHRVACARGAFPGEHGYRRKSDLEENDK